MFIVGEDFSGVPINITVAGGMAVRSVNTQSINVTILDDNIVEDFEFIGLRLTTEDPDIISVDQDVARIEISDNDGMIHSMHGAAL